MRTIIIGLAILVCLIYPATADSITVDGVRYSCPGVIIRIDNRMPVAYYQNRTIVFNVKQFRREQMKRFVFNHERAHKNIYLENGADCACTRKMLQQEVSSRAFERTCATLRLEGHGSSEGHSSGRRRCQIARKCFYSK